MRTVKRIRKLATVLLLLLTSFVVLGVSPEKSQLEAMYDKAFKAFDRAKYDEALKQLDAIDKVQPDLAESLNLRGVVYMRQAKYPPAEAAFRKALAIEPKFWNASFNLAEIPFLQKNWTEARNRFEALVAGDSGGLQPETAQLIQYKILLTFVRQGKENTADWISNKFEQAKDSPALYYANAAIAFQHDNKKEASEWLSAAEKRFPKELNRLYAESFYEIGWMQKPPGESRPAIEITSTSEHAEHIQAEAKANFERAERAFQQRDFEGALKFLDHADAAVPNDPMTTNLRGEIFMEQGKLDEAGTLFEKALQADPKFREAQYNLAQIPFKKGDYEKARDRFEALFAATPGDDKNQAAQLLKFKIYMTLLMQGKEEQAQELMDQFKFTGETPALYYAHAAWEYKHGHGEQGEDWVQSARKIYSPALNIVFADSFYDLGWLTPAGGTEPPATDALAQAKAIPPNEPMPSMRLGQAEGLPTPEVASQNAIAPAETPGAAIPAAEAAANVSVAPSVAPATSAAPTVASASKPSVAPATTAAPTVATASKPSVAPIVAQRNATEAATAQDLSKENEARWKPTFAEMVDRFSRPGTLLVGALLLAGILLLIGLVIQQARRNMASVPIYPSSTPLTEPPFAGDASDLREERHGARDLISTGPPKLSLSLKATEPAARAAVFSGAATAHGEVPGAVEGATAPNEPAESAAEAVAVPVSEPAPAVPLRDQQEVSISIEPAPPVTPVQLLISEPIAPAPPSQVEEPASSDCPEPAFEPEKDEVASEPVEATTAPAEEWELVAEEPVAQGQPVPELTTALSAEPIIPELTRPEPESPLELLEAEADLAAPIAGHRPPHSDIETPSFASKIISTEPIRLQPTTPIIMPETTITPASMPTMRSTAPTMSVQQPAGGMHTAVQLTFSLEIASMQLTPTFKMSGLQLKPTSRVVSMRLAPSQQPQPPMNLQVTFEVARIELANGSFGTIRLSPSVQEKPAVLTSPSFAISGLELVPGQGSAPVQLTPSHQEQASVHLTAEFQIAAIEFTPLFEISTIVLNSTSRRVSMQLPGSGPSSIDTAPVFEVENVQLGPGTELGLIQVAPGGGLRA